MNTYTTGPQSTPAVASDGLGNFVVAWQSGYYGISQDGNGAGVFARRFDNTGVPAGPEFQVNTYTTGQQLAPAVSSDPLGNFVVVWQSGTYGTGQDGSQAGVFGRLFDASGAPLGGEFQANTYTTGQQGGPSVASDGDATSSSPGAAATTASGRTGRRASLRPALRGERRADRPRVQVNAYDRCAGGAADRGDAGR